MEKCRLCNYEIDYSADNRREHLKKKHPELDALWEAMWLARYPGGGKENKSSSICRLIDRMFQDFCDTVWEVKF